MLQRKYFFNDHYIIDIYNISHENSKTNYEKLMILINDFLNSKNLK